MTQPNYGFNLPALPGLNGDISIPSQGTGEELKAQTRQLQLAYQLQEMIDNDKSNSKLPPLPNLSLRKDIGRNWDKYRAYGNPRRVVDIVDIVAHRPFRALYPQTFTPIAKHYLDRGVSPPFVVHEDEDYNFGVITIASMIELVQNNIEWRLDDAKDIPLILRICYKYKTNLEPYALDKMPDSDIKDYYYKLDRFIGYMENKQHEIETQGKGAEADTGSGIAAIYHALGLI